MYLGLTFVYILSFIAFYIIQPKIETINLNQILNEKKIIIEDSYSYVILKSRDNTKFKINKEFKDSNIVIDNDLKKLKKNEKDFFFNYLLNSEIEKCIQIQNNKIDFEYKDEIYKKSIKRLFILEDLKNIKFEKETTKRISLFLNNLEINIRIDYFDKSFYYKCENEINKKLLRKIDFYSNELLNE